MANIDFIEVRERINGILETLELLESDLYAADLPTRTRADWTKIILHVDAAYEALRQAAKYATVEGGPKKQPPFEAALKLFPR